MVQSSWIHFSLNSQLQSKERTLENHFLINMVEVLYNNTSFENWCTFRKVKRIVFYQYWDWDCHTDNSNCLKIVWLSFLLLTFFLLVWNPKIQNLGISNCDDVLTVQTWFNVIGSRGYSCNSQVRKLIGISGFFPMYFNNLYFSASDNFTLGSSHSIFSIVISYCSSSVSITAFTWFLDRGKINSCRAFTIIFW